MHQHASYLNFELVLKTIQFRKVNHKLENCDTYSTWCLKFTEKASFKIASEASYVYILSGQNKLKMPKNGPFWRACGQTVLPDRSIL